MEDALDESDLLCIYDVLNRKNPCLPYWDYQHFGHVAALVRSHAIGLLPFRLTKEQTTQTMDPSPKTIELLHYPGQ